MEEEDTVPEPEKTIIKDTHDLLTEPFNFYTFGVNINEGQQANIMNNVYNRLLEKEILDQRGQLDAVMGELEPSRALTKVFKQTEEQSLKKIQEV